jgi:hypothetical protein
MVLAIAILLLVLTNFLFERSVTLWLVIVGLIVVWIGISILQIYYLARARNGMRSD